MTHETREAHLRFEFQVLNPPVCVCMWCNISPLFSVFVLQAALIMQVLQLTPEQIAMLPPEQRQSILILKEQIQKTAGAP